MQNVYLIDYFREDGTYRMTSGIAFTSLAAAKRYAEDCTSKTQIKKVNLVSLSDF